MSMVLDMRPPCRRLGAAAVAWILAGLALGSAAAQDRLDLRDGKVLTGRRVLSFDEDGVRVDGTPARTLGWEEIQSGVVSQDQARFDRLLKEVSQPLYQIRLCLEARRYEDILTHAEAVFPRYAGRRSPTAYLVCQGLMWSRLAQGRREAALEPYLYCLDLLARDARKLTPPGPRRLPYDPASGLCPELPPVWFDEPAAKEALPRVRKVIEALGKSAPPGVYIYGATLALTARDSAAADRLLGQIQAPSRAIRELMQIAAAQRELLSGQSGPAVRALEQVDQVLDAHKPLAHYWLGLAFLASAEEQRRKEGVLQLLHLPALYGTTAPDLAGAGLYHASQALDALQDAAGTVALRRELLQQYAQTFHGVKLKGELEALKEVNPKPRS